MSTYHGRHRPPTRAERRALERRASLPKALSRAYALPTAVAATLALTAAGATAAQSSPFAGKSPKEVAAAITDGSAATALLDDPEVTEDARSEVEAEARDTSGLAERRSQASASLAEGQARAQERDRAQRSEDREQAERSEEPDAAQDVAEESSDRAPDEDSDGDSDEASSSDSDWVKPLEDAVLTSPYGERWGRLHAGVDYGATIGTPLRSMGSGEVVGAGPMSGYGNYIDIEYTDGSVSRYGHLDSISASVGDDVEPGDVVARSGNTGQSTGPHLHLEIRPGGGEPIDPAGWLAERGID